jgi:membrane-associated phospholipid phosphatase
VRRILHPRGMLILTTACFVAMTLAAILGGAHAADAGARDSLLALNTPVVVAVMRMITLLGHAWFLVPALAVLLAAVAEARARWWVWVGVMLLAPIAETVLKALIGRPRPFDASFGFPSGHATAAATFFGAVIYLAGNVSPPARTWVRVLAGLAIVLVGLSRVMLRAHWPSDVIGGVALGLALASAAALLARPPRPTEA